MKTIVQGVQASTGFVGLQYCQMNWQNGQHLKRWIATERHSKSLQSTTQLAYPCIAQHLVNIWSLQSHHPDTARHPNNLCIACAQTSAEDDLLILR